MIPYFSWQTIALGPLTIYVWGVFLAIGFLAGGYMAAWFAKHRGDDPKIVWEILPRMMLAGFIGGRLGHVLFYAPSFFLAHPMEIFKVWDGGLSVFGGMIGCIVVGLLFLRKKRVDVWRYADILVFGLPFGKFFGRIGCFFIHDHPGMLTNFVLGVRFPDGTVRHDLGLYLALNALVLSFLFLWLARRDRPVGTYIAVFAVWYGCGRFFLDFLRIIDVRFAGLTPGQYFSLFLCVFGIFIILWISKRVEME